MGDPLQTQINAFLKRNTSDWARNEVNTACAYMLRHAGMFTARARNPNWLLGNDPDWRLIWNEAVRAAGVIPHVSITVH